MEFRVNGNGVKVRGLREELYERVEGDVKLATRYWLDRRQSEMCQGRFSKW
jgi:hypothetical protein